MEQKIFAVILLMIGLASLMLYSIDTKPAKLAQFEKFKADYGKFYLDESEEQYRKQIFMNNLMLIEFHNADKTQTYQKGVNQFADLTNEEFIQTYLQTKVPQKQNSINQISQVQKINAEIDWIASGKVTPIKNQGSCSGGAWAFSAVANLQSVQIIKGNKTLNLSEQQLLDCSRNDQYNNQGCDGGWMDFGFRYIKQKGLTTTDKYPFVEKNQDCQTKDDGQFKIKSIVNIQGCDNLLNSLSLNPITVAIDASHWSLYRGGIFRSCGTILNHATVVVGVTTDYWRLKNSWGVSWGQSGYIRIGRGNTCGVCSFPSYPTI